MLITDKKAQRLEAKGKGALGTPRIAVERGEIVRYIGDELPPRPAGKHYAMLLILDFPEHLALDIQNGFTKTVTLVIPKRDVLHWGVIREREIPQQSEREPTAAATVGKIVVHDSMALLAGLAGLSNWVVEGVDADTSERPAIFITYDHEGSEHAVFMTFAL